jgi:hypothetical protein
VAVLQEITYGYLLKLLKLELQGKVTKIGKEKWLCSNAKTILKYGLMQVKKLES